MAEQYVNRTVTYEEYGRVNPSSGSTTMIEAQFATKGKQSFKKWDICMVCGFAYPKDQLVYIKGAPYCIPQRDYEDVPGQAAPIE